MKHKQFMRLLGLRFEGLRTDRKETLTYVAEAVGYSRRTIRRMEKGEVDWNILTGAHLCRHYGIDLSLLFEEGNHTKLKI